MTIPEITEALEGASAVLTEISTEHPDPRLALVIAALGWREARGLVQSNRRFSRIHSPIANKSTPSRAMREGALRLEDADDGRVYHALALRQ